MTEGIFFRKKVSKIGNSYWVLIPEQIMDSMQIVGEEEVKIGMDEKKKGKFIWIAKSGD